MRSRIVKDRLRRQVIVTTFGGDTFSGVLYDWDAFAVVLRQATLLSGVNGTHVPVDGEVLLMTEDVAYTQVPA